MAVLDQLTLKRRVAEHALGYVEDGMRLADRVRAGLRLLCVATSEVTRRQAAEAGIPLTTLDDTPELDLTIDGADEFDPELRLIKGGGGALLHEKIVARASRRMVVIADASKGVERLGRFPLPVEVVPFGLGSTRRLIVEAAAAASAAGVLALRRRTSGEIFVTDGGHYILDCHFGVIPQPEALARHLVAIPGVVEHGLFIGFATAIVTADADGVRVIGQDGVSTTA